MQRKNDRFLCTVAFTCTTILFFNSLFPVYRSPGKRLAAARQSSASVAPKPAAPPIAPAAEEELIKPIAVEKKIEEENIAEVAAIKARETEKIEKEEEENAIENQVILPAPTGFLSAAYAIVTPLILVTLNAGVGVAIEAGTKSLIKAFSKRPLYLERKPAIEKKYMKLITPLLNNYPDAMKQGEFDLIPEKELEPWLESAAALEVVDQNTSFSYIFSKAAYTFAIYAIFNTIAKITGYSASVTFDTLLQSVSPTQPKISKQKK